MNTDQAPNYPKIKSPCENFLIMSLPPYLGRNITIKFQLVQTCFYGYRGNLNTISEGLFQYNLPKWHTATLKLAIPIS